ncbi:hypothetical protein UFOVP112_136 [uncultured Caudovirales phage]|uniref:Uncharacterized protein n=1 Tax=uncultured Caudovirales phage TaxID=2100421 RepID=A0A6J5L7L1_9CAUD|nr:hypothetical protein UFOVP112_136 [uncultured Caudovirales phage]
MSASNEEIVELLNSYDKDTKATKRNLLQLCWFMRGSVSYDDAMLLSYEERNMINDLIKENLETTEKSGLPFF